MIYLLKKLNSPIQTLTEIVLLSAFGLLLTLRGWTNICFAILVLTAITYLTFRQKTGSVKNEKNLWFIVFLSLPVITLLLTQTIRHDFILRSYDAPIRLLLAIPLVFFFSSKKINIVNVLGFSIPFCLIATALAIYLHPEYIAQWSGRYATKFVDPNSFGNFSVILTSFCLFNLNNPLKINKSWMLYQLVGLITGVGLILGSGTRGSWLAIPLIITFWLITNRQYMSGKRIYIGVTVLAMMAVMAYMIFPSVSMRFLSIFNEIKGWLNHSVIDSSAGIRLTMWKMSWALFQHNPLLGYGDTGVRNFLNEPWVTSVSTSVAKQTIFCCGPHNEFLANLLRSGILGGISVLGLLIYPIYLFAPYLKSKNTQIVLAAQIGISYLMVMSVCSMSMEVFNLKYDSSFYALVIAGLVGQISYLTKQDNQACQT